MFTSAQISSWVSELGELNPIRYLLFEEENEILGIAVLKADNIEGFELLALGVDPKRRNKGIGSALIGECCRYAAGKGFTAVKTMVFADNLRMQRLVLIL